MRYAPIILFFFLVMPSVMATENIYSYDRLQLQLNINGEFALVPQGTDPRLQHVTARLLLYPQDDFRQQITEMNTLGQIKNNSIEFLWDDRKLGKKSFSYSAIIQTNDARTAVREKVPFPLPSIRGYEEYLQPTVTIDSDNPTVRAKAAELAEGEDDLFKVTFKLANWVSENVEYDLTTLTAETSQKASWVLEHREGVCDEMTSLFVAMARSLGIPARFVSGISYTNSKLFSYPWQPHGWAEVYFPGTGWVSFDIAFGEYGYVDVTHIKLRDSFDPQEPGTKYEWLANDVNLLAKNLNLTVNVMGRGNSQPEQIELEQEILAPLMDFGSYNRVKGIVKNSASFYAATTLQLAVPPEISIIGQNQRTILMTPKQVKETYWVLKIPVNLEQDYAYTFPTIIYSEKNHSATDSFTAQRGETSYSLEEIQRVTADQDDKTYSRKISLQCTTPTDVKVNTVQKLECTLKNNGNTNLKDINFCLGKVCEMVDLSINQQKTSSITLPSDDAGRKRIIVSAENEFIERKNVVEYQVLDPPAIKAVVEYPPKVNYGETIHLTVEVQKKSFSIPRNVTLIIRGMGTESIWQVEELLGNESAGFNLEMPRLGKLNELIIKTSWHDAEGREYSEPQTVEIAGKGKTLGEKIKMFWNGILNALSG
ncbi:transglutaminase domain-containing protein [Candidatus Woesearchaeota archaeon]|nr:transglutaminase domain-containing protein [Candidatus Woesearchaeota archaeon]